MEKEFLNFVADVMGVDVSELSLETKYNEYEKWNSLMMLTLVMELELEYDINIPIESVNKVHSLRDLYEIVNNK